MQKKLFFITALFLSSLANAQKEVNVAAIPADAEIFEISGNGIAIKKGVGNVILKLDRDKAVTLEVRKSGFVSEKKTFLREKDGVPSATIELTQRVVQVNASPADAMIFLNGVDIGKSPKTISIDKGVSITIDIKKPGICYSIKNTL